jgi:hypothetical protein
MRPHLLSTRLIIINHTVNMSQARREISTRIAQVAAKLGGIFRRLRTSRPADSGNRQTFVLEFTL